MKPNRKIEWVREPTTGAEVGEVFRLDDAGVERPVFYLADQPLWLVYRKVNGISDDNVDIKVFETADEAEIYRAAMIINDED